MSKLNLLDIQEKLKAGQKQQAKEFVESKVQSVPVVETPEPVVEAVTVEVEAKPSYKVLARKEIKSLTESMQTAKKNVKSPVVRKMNMH
ncbi:hypothetical protein GIV63_31500, partial [Pseudomonas sp. PA-3-10C]